MPEKSQNEQQGKDQKQVLSFSESLAAGCLTGSVATFVNMPAWALSTRVQQGQPFTLNPRILYRGTAVVLSTMVPSTMAQLTATAYIERSYEKSVGGSTTISPEARMLTSFMGGATASPLSNMITLTITQQHKHSISAFLPTAKDFLKKHSARRLFTGLPSTMMADGLFILSFYGLAPTIKKHIRAADSENVLFDVGSGFLAGWFAAVATHPAVRVKTIQHTAADTNGKVPSILAAVKNIVAQDGYVGFYKGLSPRLIGLPLTVAAASIVSERFNEYIESTRLDSI